VTFNPRPIPCTVEHVIGHPLAQAKRNLHLAGCKVGKVRYAYASRNENFGEVISQNPHPHWQRLHGAVDLVVSKGRRGP
jgi:beta-lactam-binding protein with PASTA domain